MSTSPTADPSPRPAGTYTWARSLRLSFVFTAAPQRLMSAPPKPSLNVIANDLVALPGLSTERKVTFEEGKEPYACQPEILDSKSQLAHLLVSAQMATFDV